jgi:branched-chain amino acid transport system substrate-binding protein
VLPRLAAPVAAFAALLVAALALAACGGSDDEGDAGVQALPETACGELEYGGEGDADVLIASDLPMEGDSASRSEQMVEAIRIVLEDAEWKAGDTNVAFQACDDADPETGEWSKQRCRENAQAYAANPDVVGVVGTYNSGCAQVEIPVLNEAPDGGVAMVSPGNTLICLTEDSQSCDPDEPDLYYPSGERNYARVVPNDAVQGAGLAQFASEQGITSPYVLFASQDDTSRGQAETFIGAALGLGLEVSGFDVWDPDAPDYEDLMDRVAEASPDSIVLAGLLEQNGAKLIQDKVAGLGGNDELPLLAFDGFAQQATIDEAGEAAQGMYVSVPGKSPQTLKGPGEELVSALESDSGNEPVELFAPYAGQAAQVLLDSIEAGGDQREVVISALFRTEVADGIVGSFKITKTGDPNVSPISVSVAGDSFEPEATITPERELIEAARRE